MKKLTVKEVADELFKIKSSTGDLLTATADFGVEKGGKPIHTHARFADVDYVDSLVKEIRKMALDIRERCVSGFDGREDGKVFSKIGKNRQK